MRRLLTVALVLMTVSCTAASGQTSVNAGEPSANPDFRELTWDSYLDKVQGAWMGKMIGVTFGQPWEFQYQEHADRLRHHRLAALADSNERVSGKGRQ